MSFGRNPLAHPSVKLHTRFWPGFQKNYFYILMTPLKSTISQLVTYPKSWLQTWRLANTTENKFNNNTLWHLLYNLSLQCEYLIAGSNANGILIWNRKWIHPHHPYNSFLPSLTLSWLELKCSYLILSMIWIRIRGGAEKSIRLVVGLLIFCLYLTPHYPRNFPFFPKPN